MYAKQSSIEARRTPIHNNNSKTEFVLIYIRNRGLILYSIGCALCTLDYHITFTTQESIGREREECTTYMHARVFVCVCSSTNSKHFLFRADYGRLLLIGLVDSLCVFCCYLFHFISYFSHFIITFSLR